MPNIGEPLPNSIYKFAYGQGDKVIAPKRYWRHALDLGSTGQTLVKEFAGAKIPVGNKNDNS